MQVPVRVQADRGVSLFTELLGQPDSRIRGQADPLRRPVDDRLGRAVLRRDQTGQQADGRGCGPRRGRVGVLEDDAAQRQTVEVG